LNHFIEPLFPRTISTFKSQGKQFEVFSKEEMIKAYAESDLLDCRVNAYPSYTDYKGIQRYPPNFIFADLDRSTFGNLAGLESALQTTLSTIRIKINGRPTVLWTGNGYHIYQPINAEILEQFIEFEEFENPSLKFIRFAEYSLTCGKADPSHNPSFKSCMIRIPGSYNSKYSAGKNKINIFQKWDGYRPPISLLLGSFHAYLVDQKIKEMKLKKRIEKRYRNAGYHNNSISWIESLLQTPIEDYRKNAIGLILAPYLINIKKLSYDDAFQMIRDWLDLCNKLRTLSPNFSYRIRYSLNTAIRKQQLPIKLSTLEKKNKELHTLLDQKKV
jgi:Primase X